MTNPLSINEYAASQGLSEMTVRGRIRAGGLDAWFEGQNGVHSGDEAPTQNGQVDIQIEQVSDKVGSPSVLRFEEDGQPSQ